MLLGALSGGVAGSVAGKVFNFSSKFQTQFKVQTLTSRLERLMMVDEEEHRQQGTTNSGHLQ